MNDKISVIIPCYNVQNYIGRCLKSIENQTYIQNGEGELEVILYDDASTDGTYEQLLKFEEKYPENVLVISGESNSGPANARNTALRYATGTYISFVDSDDVIDVTMLSRMHDVMILHNVDVVECGYRTFSCMEELSDKESEEDSHQQQKIKDNKGYLLNIETSSDRGRFILNSFKTAVWGRLYKKSFLDENSLYFPENMIYGEDNFFSGLVMLTCKSYYHITDTLYYYYNNVNGIIRRANDNERIRQLADIMKLYINELDARGFLGAENGRYDEYAWGSGTGGSNKDVETLSNYAAEFEWYMIYKYFMDPVSFVISRKFPDWREQASYFGRELLNFFPEAYNNVYLNSDRRWADYVTLLNEEKI